MIISGVKGQCCVILTNEDSMIYRVNGGNFTPFPFQGCCKALAVCDIPTESKRALTTIRVKKVKDYKEIWCHFPTYKFMLW